MEKQSHSESDRDTFAPGRVLIIEDELGPRESLRLILKDTYQVEMAGDVPEALTALKAKQYDVITMDLQVPGSDGFSLLHEIREIDPLAEIVAITAYGSMDVALSLMEEGVSLIIAKPFNTREVLQAVDKARRSNERRSPLMRRLKAPPPAHRDGQTDVGVANGPAVLGTRNDYLDFLLLFSRTLEANDPYAIGHSEKVCKACRRVAAKMDFDEETSFELEVSALLHDIGKAGLPYHLLSKTDPPTFQEWEVIRSHPSRGIVLVKPLGFSKEIQDAILYHHERYDGQGYPESLAGERIPLLAQIISVCDAYDAMVTTKPYRPPLPATRAFKEIRRCTGSQFAPQAAQVFLEVMEERINDPE
ncbi:HD domain-containing phosphohydrolase [Acidobacteriota bacterium]